MGTRRINIDLNKYDSIADAIKELQKYKDEIHQKTDLFVKKLSENGVEFAKARVSTYDAIFTGELLENIYSERKDDAFYLIVSGSEHSAFVEFGTGQLGQEGSYPYDLPDGVSWEYNSGKTIFEISPGEYGWFYPKDGKWYFTQGMPSRPYMMETWQELYLQVQKVAKEVFAE